MSAVHCVQIQHYVHPRTGKRLVRASCGTCFWSSRGYAFASTAERWRDKHRSGTAGA